VPLPSARRDAAPAVAGRRPATESETDGLAVTYGDGETPSIRLNAALKANGRSCVEKEGPLERVRNLESIRILRACRI
jgi:hypothetical protein